MSSQCEQIDSLPGCDSSIAISGLWRWLVALAAGVATCAVILLATWRFDHNATSLHDARVHADTVNSLAAVRGAAESVINKHVYLTQGLSSYVAVHPDLSQQEFAALAQLIMEDGRGIRSVTSIKDNVINDVYPRDGNERAIGLDLLSHPDQRAAVEHAIETGQPWLAGPIQLVQGGEAFVNRAPVYAVQRDDESTERKYWGMVSILIDKQILVDDISAAVPAGTSIAIRGRNDRELGDIFLGDPTIQTADPIVSEISLPTGSWQIYGVPQAGWPTADPQAATRRIFGGILALVSGILAFCLVGTTMRYRIISIRLRSANERERTAHEAAKQSAQQAEQRAAELEETQLASLNIMEDMEAARRQLAEMNEALGQSNEELQQFAYVASHDLKTPLRAISGFAQFLKDDYQGQLDEQADDYIERIVEGVRRMQQLINDLLEFSRIDSRGRQFQPTDLQDVFDDVLSLLQADIDDTCTDVKCDNLPTLLADRAQLGQLLQNLIGNALRYNTDSSPQVHVSAERAGDVWTIAVRDNGIGIAPEHHERIFEIFRRLHTQREYSGTGIGLAVCRRIVLRHGGRLWLESAPGEGSTFFFTMGACVSEPKQAEPELEMASL